MVQRDVREEITRYVISENSYYREKLNVNKMANFKKKCFIGFNRVQTDRQFLA